MKREFKYLVLFLLLIIFFISNSCISYGKDINSILGKKLNLKESKINRDLNKLSPKISNGKAKDVDVSKNKLQIVDKIIEDEIKGINSVTGENMIKNNKVKSEFPGAILTIVKDGKLIKNSSYGYKKIWDKYKKIKNPDKTTVNTMYDIASNTKMYATNYAIMKLIYEKKLSLDDKVENYLENYKDNNTAKIKGKDKITIRNLLRHNAGHSVSIDFYNKKKAGDLYALNKEETINALGKIPLVYEPETKNIYSDLDYMILGYIVEKITNMPLDKYVEEEIYKPLGLKRTCFNPLKKGFNEEEIAATERNGNTRDGMISFEGIRDYTLQGEVHDEKAFYCMGGVSGHAGLFSTGEELAVLCQLLLNGGSYNDFVLCDKSIINEFIKPDYLDPSWGLGWNIQDGKRSRAWMFSPYTYNTIGHTGWTGTLTNIDFENNMIIILLTNRRNTPCYKENFDSDKYETGRYGSITTLVYEALLENRELVNVDKEEYITEVISNNNSQVDCIFPDKELSSRYYVRNKRGFYGYRGKGHIVIENEGVTEGELYINGHNIDISQILKSNSSKEIINIGKYVVNGINSLKVLNIKPNNSKMKISVLYPELIEKNIKGEKESLKFTKKKLNKNVKNFAFTAVKNGKIIEKFYCGSIKENKLIPLGNGTEVFSTIFAINKLISEGKLNYNDLANKYIPEINESIKIKDLLEHTSGLPKEINKKLVNNEKKEITLAKRDNELKKLISIKPEFIPGTKSRYSAYDAYLLGTIIEKITLMPQDKYVEENIYTPLGLKHTMYNPMKKGINKKDIVLDKNENKEYTKKNLDGVSGGYGLYTTTKDLAVLCQTIINYGGYGGVEIFSKDVTAHFTSPTDKDKNYGHGLLIFNEEDEKRECENNKLNKKVGIISDTGIKVVIDMMKHEAVIFKGEVL
ncbi:penicillin binding protein PBP4B [Clostridium tarantellae]|uniref:Penicillin binding protein PBP4B n=1 Tax=Clostridium tarantellae TaxID=39493 RepID=A0A6I1MPQ4_9CLOT|nr:penicillin binding protein PBP4B [Clostridium tarantellae]MPQ44783.1 penicillin binding protein PBP4B [Clostridium tarantellae]